MDFKLPTRAALLPARVVVQQPTRERAHTRAHTAAAAATMLPNLRQDVGGQGRSVLVLAAGSATTKSRQAACRAS